MMAGAYQNQNRAIHASIVELVAAFLAQRGLPAVPRKYHERLSDSLADPHALAGDVRGVPGVFVKVSTRRTAAPWAALGDAQTGAQLTGASVGAAVSWRSDRPVEESYVTMSLADFSLLVGSSPIP